MRWFIRMFFRGLRVALGPPMLLWEALSKPQALVRTPQAQAQVDAHTRQLTLYQFKTCPFCIRARREIARLGLNIELRDAQHDAQHRQALLAEGGKVQVPCLRIMAPGAEPVWIYESEAITRYLRERFAEPEPSTAV